MLFNIFSISFSRKTISLLILLILFSWLVIKSFKETTQIKAVKKSSYSKKKKVKKNILNGIAYVQSTFNNTIVTIADTSGNVISSTVNPAVDKSYHGGTHNPHTDTGWSGSQQGGSSYSRPGTEGAPGHHWADGGRVGLRYGGLLSIL